MIKEKLKTYLVVSILFMLVTASQAKEPIAGYLFAHMTSENYGDLYYSISTDGRHWTRLNKGETVFDEYRGHADIITDHDGKFYLLGNPPKGGKIRVWKSDNLIDWEQVADHVPDMSKHPEMNKFTFWVGAPKMFYDKLTKRYIITWHSTSYKKRGEDPNEYWNHMRTFYTITKDFKKFSAPQRLFEDKDQASIDVIIREEGGKYYAILKDERYPYFDYTNGKSIRICSSDKLEGPYKATNKRVSPNFREAPALIPRKDEGWYLYYEQYPGVQYGVSTSKTLNGEWYDVYYHEYHVPANARHGCMVALNQKQFDGLLEVYGDETTILGTEILDRQKPEPWLYVSFKDPGTWGVFFAMSTDAKNWIQLKNGTAIFTPTKEMRITRDPFLIKGPDDTYHMVWTAGKRRMGYSYSTDLINWSPQRIIPVDAGNEKVQNTWAPELYWDKSKKEWLVFWSSTYAGDFPETDGQVKNDKNHRIYSMRTKDFETFSEIELFYDPGYPVIDATIVDVKDSVVMIFKDEREYPDLKKYLKVCWAKTIDGPWSEPSEAFTANWTEGPSVIKHKDGYLIFYDKYDVPQHMGAVFTKDFRTFEDVTDEMTFPELYKHGSFLQIPHAEARKLFEYCIQNQ